MHFVKIWPFFICCQLFVAYELLFFSLFSVVYEWTLGLGRHSNGTKRWWDTWLSWWLFYVISVLKYEVFWEELKSFAWCWGASRVFFSENLDERNWLNTTTCVFHWRIKETTRGSRLPLTLIPAPPQLLKPFFPFMCSPHFRPVSFLPAFCLLVNEGALTSV